MMQEISIVSIIFTAALVLICLFLVLAPFFSLNSYLSFANKGQDSATNKEVLLSTLNELEFEYKMDKISHADYKNLKKQYEAQVVSIMKDEEEQMTSQTVDKDLMAEIEREIEASMKSYQNKKGEGK
jgi:cytochrome c-type biogenesis protein CcmI